MRYISQLSAGDRLVKKKRLDANPARTGRWKFEARSFTYPNWAAGRVRVVCRDTSEKREQPVRLT